MERRVGEVCVVTEMKSVSEPLSVRESDNLEGIERGSYECLEEREWRDTIDTFLLDCYPPTPPNNFEMERGRKDVETKQERELEELSLAEFEREFGQVDESLNDEVQSLLDSCSHLGESEWKDKIDEFLRNDHPPIPFDGPKAIEEKICVSSDLEPDPCVPKIKRNLGVPSESMHAGHTLSEHHEDPFPISHDTSPDLSLIYGRGPN